MLGSPYCPACGKCSACGRPQFEFTLQQVVPGYPFKFAEPIGTPVDPNYYNVCENPFAPAAPTHDGHGDDGRLMAGP